MCAAKAGGRISDQLAVDDAADPAWSDRILHEIGRGKFAVFADWQLGNVDRLQQTVPAGGDRIGQFKIDDARVKLKSVYPKLEV